MKFIRRLAWPVVLLLLLLLGVDCYQSYQYEQDRLQGIEQTISIMERAAPGSLAPELIALQRNMITIERQMLEHYRAEIGRMWWSKSRAQELKQRIEALDKTFQKALDTAPSKPGQP